MDMDKHEKLAFESNIAMFCAVILVMCIILCCWIVPILCQKRTNRANDPQPQNEEAIEMEEVNRERNRENTSFENEIQQSNRDTNQENTTNEA